MAHGRVAIGAFPIYSQCGRSTLLLIVSFAGHHLDSTFTLIYAFMSTAEAHHELMNVSQVQELTCFLAAMCGLPHQVCT